GSTPAALPSSAAAEPTTTTSATRCCLRSGSAPFAVRDPAVRLELASELQPAPRGATTTATAPVGAPGPGRVGRHELRLQLRRSGSGRCKTCGRVVLGIEIEDDRLPTQRGE